MLNKIGSIVLRVNDLDKSVSFYRDELGMKVDFEMEDFVMFNTSAICFGLEQVDKKNGVDGGTNLAFEMDDGVDKFYGQLLKKGMRMKNPPTNMDWGGRMATLVDPDGYEISFYEMLSPLCEACGMQMKSDKMRGGALENNPYCVYCCDNKGELKSRKEVRDAMVKYYMNQRGVGLLEAEKSVDDIMKWLPAWKDA